MTPKRTAMGGSAALAALAIAWLPLVSMAGEFEVADGPQYVESAYYVQAQYAQYAEYEVAQAAKPQPEPANDDSSGSQTAPVSAAPARPAQDVIHYQPPSRGAPRARVGGGTRAPGPAPSVQALAPPHVALTMNDAPTLYWYVDSAPGEGVQVVFTLLDEESIDPVATVELPRPETAGIQALRLADHGIHLEPGIEYEWSIALVVDPSKRSHDVVSTAWLQRIAASEGATPRTAVELAERSLWYDALAVLSEQIAEQPANTDLRALRSSLLDQAELKVAIQ